MSSEYKRPPRQTIEFADRPDTGERIAAHSLLEMSEEVFRDFRRRSIESSHARRRDDQVKPFFLCASCETPVYLVHLFLQSSDYTENRYFRHAKPALCPWYTPSKFSAEELRALQFHGQKEGRDHLELKAAIARALDADPEASDVHTERIHLGQALKGEWKRPDVSCNWREKHLVVELQLSYTFLSEVIKRDSFYEAEKAHILWVFAEPNHKRAVVRDEVYYNKRNLFVFDPDARQESASRGRLVLRCYYAKPELNPAGQLVDVEESKLVELGDLQFSGFRPFYYDYDTERDRLNQVIRQREKLDEERRNEMAKAPKPVLKPEWQGDRQSGWLVEEAEQGYRSFLWTLINFCDQDRAGQADEFELRLAIGRLPDAAARQVANTAMGYPYFDALRRLLSIAQGRPAYSKLGTVYEILAAALQPGADTQRQFALLYVEAWLAYEPEMSERHNEQMETHLRLVRKKLAAGDHSYKPDLKFANFVANLFPQLRPVIGGLNSNRPQRAPVPRRAVLRWPANFDRAMARRALDSYKHEYPEVDWVKLLKELYLFYKDRLTPQQAINYAEVAYSVDRKIAERFLIEAGMAIWGAAKG